MTAAFEAQYGAVKLSDHVRTPDDTILTSSRPRNQPQLTSNMHNRPPLLPMPLQRFLPQHLRDPRPSRQPHAPIINTIHMLKQSQFRLMGP